MAWVGTAIQGAQGKPERTIAPRAQTAARPWLGAGRSELPDKNHARGRGGREHGEEGHTGHLRVEMKRANLVELVRLLRREKHKSK